jgi:hypothetical protein
MNISISVLFKSIAGSDLFEPFLALFFSSFEVIVFKDNFYTYFVLLSIYVASKDLNYFCPFPSPTSNFIAL